MNAPTNLRQFQIGDEATDGLNTGKIVQVLYLLEFTLWPGEPPKQVWRKPEDLRPVKHIQAAE